MHEVRAAVQRIIPHQTPVQQTGTGTAPSNIALCKYWGKRNEALKLPLTGSLSISLGELGTTTRIRISEEDRFTLNGQEQNPEARASQRLFSFLDLFRTPDQRLTIESENTIPMAAGLASSASGFAALVLALNDLFGWNLDHRNLSILARLGSGSACRSLDHGFVEWHKGEAADGSDSFASRLDVRWPDFRVGILTLSESEKPVGSSEGMKRTVETSALYTAWPEEAGRALPRIRTAIHEKDFPALGRAAEQNALAMHATMMSAWPPILYWRPGTVEVLHRVHTLRASGTEVYATMDAGPNVKLLFLKAAEPALKEAFPGAQVITPFKGSAC
jgi:diphosphomevalonate decarboxylase